MYRRKPAVAGAFYPANPQRLGGMIDGFMSEAGGAAGIGEVIGLLSPHAGYVYSGPIAAYSFSQVPADVTLAVVLAPSHRARFNGASVLTEGVYETPLGEVPIDAEICDRLKGLDNFSVIKEAHEMEHSLEVQVPFLQRVLKDFSLVPVIIGTVDIDICASIARGLRDVLTGEKRKFVVIISTDLSHYYAYAAAQAMDGRFIDALKTFDPEKVRDAIRVGKAEACGEGPILAGMSLCRHLGATKVEVLKYANSGDTAGSRDQVVGYLSAAFVK